MGNSLTNKFGAAVTTAGMATFGAVLGVSAYEDEGPDLGNISDYIQQTVVSDIVHEPIENPLFNDFIDFNTDVDAFYGEVSAFDSSAIDAILEAEAATPDFFSGNFVTFTNMSQKDLPYAAAKQFQEEFLQNGNMVLNEADLVSSDLRPVLERANLERAQNFLYISDQESQRQLDHWGIGENVDDVNPLRKDVFAGDCDDYSLRGLVKNNVDFGISFAAQTMVTMETKDPNNRIGHAMLMVRFEDGDVFYDMDGSARSPHEVAKEYDLKYAMSLTDKGYFQQVSVTPQGVEATMDDVPRHEDVELPRPRPDPAPTNSMPEI
jgi:predicted transglutaminase-like cysteine proteinase